MAKKKLNTTKLVFASLLIALGVVLKFSLEIVISPDFRINFVNIPIMLSGITLGPVYGFAVGFISDFLQYLVRPGGVYYPGFTLSTALYGLIPGLMFMYFKKKSDNPFTLKNILLTTLICEIICSMLLNTFFLFQLYSYSVLANIPLRAIRSIVMVFVNGFIIKYLIKALKNKLMF